MSAPDPLKAIVTPPDEKVDLECREHNNLMLHRAQQPAVSKVTAKSQFPYYLTKNGFQSSSHKIRHLQCWGFCISTRGPLGSQHLHPLIHRIGGLHGIFGMPTGDFTFAQMCSRLMQAICNRLSEHWIGRLRDTVCKDTPSGDTENLLLATRVLGLCTPLLHTTVHPSSRIPLGTFLRDLPTKLSHSERLHAQDQSQQMWERHV